MGEIFWGVVIAYFIGGLVLSEVSDVEDVTVYTESCVDGGDIFQCEDKSRHKENFRIDFKNQRVISDYLLFSKGYQCVVFDVENWRCTSDDGTFSYSMRDGRYSDTNLSEYKNGKFVIHEKEISKLVYWYYRLSN